MPVLRPTIVLAALALTATALAASPAAAADPSPPGANDWSCKPSSAHPYAVVLVPGTAESMAKNWATMSPYLKSSGYCVFSLNYGYVNGVPAVGHIAESAKELRTFVDRVRTATGTQKVDVVGHSQGGMMPRQYMRFLGGASKVNELVGIAPSNHGTKGVIVPMSAPSATSPSATTPNPCPACDEQKAGSTFLRTLNAGGDLVSGPDYTVLSTRYDEVVTPYTSQFLKGPGDRVTNITLQNLCPADTIEHDQSPNDPVVQQLVRNALDREHAPASKTFQPACP